MKKELTDWIAIETRSASYYIEHIRRLVREELPDAGEATPGQARAIRDDAMRLGDLLNRIAAWREVVDVIEYEEPKP